MMFLEKSIFDVLTNDAELVALTGHAPNAPRIYAAYPDNTSGYPVVAFWPETSSNTIPAIDEVQSTMFNFAVYVLPRNTVNYQGWATTGQALAKRIVARIISIFTPGNQQNKDLSNSQVRSLAVLFKTRFPVFYQQELEQYQGNVTVEVTWCHKP